MSRASTEKLVMGRWLLSHHRSALHNKRLHRLHRPYWLHDAFCRLCGSVFPCPEGSWDQILKKYRTQRTRQPHLQLHDSVKSGQNLAWDKMQKEWKQGMPHLLSGLRALHPAPISLFSPVSRNEIHFLRQRRRTTRTCHIVPSRRKKHEETQAIRS